MKVGSDVRTVTVLSSPPGRLALTFTIHGVQCVEDINAALMHRHLQKMIGDGHLVITLVPSVTAQLQ